MEVQLGLESAHPTVLREMNKESDPQTYFRVIKALLGQGINVATSFIIGFPGETEQTARATIDFIKSIDPDFVGFSAFQAGASASGVVNHLLII